MKVSIRRAAAKSAENVLRKFHTSPFVKYSDDLENITSYMESHSTPSASILAEMDYSIPSALFSSYKQQKRDQTGRFKDVAIVKLRSGDGGDGRVSFLRESGRSVGPADGGDGGAGGNVFIQAVEGLNSLHHIRHIYKAQAGRPGGSTQLNGKHGENVILQVPVGTQVHWSPGLDTLKRLYYESDGGHEEQMPLKVPVVQNRSRFDNDGSIQLTRDSFRDGDGWVFKEKEEEFYREQPYFRKLLPKVRYFDLIARRKEQEQDTFPFSGIDLKVPGEPYKLLQGGMGGLGNMHFLTGDIRNPRFAKRGRYGIEATFILELKLIADLGLVGLPNAGKSSLLRAISRARPRVGDWEFTTLTPSIGTISLGISEPSFSVADIPGIIEGSSENKGLGLGFLRHIERSGGLVFVVSLERPDPVADLGILLRELGPERTDGKKKLVVATKADLPDTQANYETLEQYLKDQDEEWDIVPCSALENGNIENVIRAMGKTAGKIN